jgi:hypothetical protein
MEEEPLLESSPLHDVLEPPAEVEEIPPESTNMAPISEECPETALSTETDLLVDNSRAVDLKPVEELGPGTQADDDVPTSTERLTESPDVVNDTEATSVEDDIAEAGPVVSSDIVPEVSDEQEVSPEVTENIQEENPASPDEFAEQADLSLTLNEPMDATTDDPQPDHLEDHLVESTVGESATYEPVEEDTSQPPDAALEAEQTSVALADIDHDQPEPAEINEIPLDPVLEGTEELALPESSDETALAEREVPSEEAIQAASEDPGLTVGTTDTESEEHGTNPITATDDAEMAAQLNDGISTPEIATEQDLFDFDQEIPVDEGLSIENEEKTDDAIVDSTEFESPAEMIPTIETAEDDSNDHLPANDLPQEPTSVEQQQVDDDSMPEAVVEESVEPPVADISVESPVDQHSGEEHSLETIITQGEVPEEEALDDIDDALAIPETPNMGPPVYDDPNTQPVVQDDVVPIEELEEISRDAVTNTPIDANEVTVPKSVEEEPLESRTIDDNTAGEESLPDHPEEPVASVETSVEESVVDHSNIEEEDVDEPHPVEEADEMASIEPPVMDLLDGSTPMEDSAVEDSAPVEEKAAEDLPVAEDSVASMEPISMEEVEDIVPSLQTSEPQSWDDTPLEDDVLEEHIEEEVVPSVHDSEGEEAPHHLDREFGTVFPEPLPTEEDVPEEDYGESDIPAEAESGVDPVFNDEAPVETVPVETVPVETVSVEIEPVEVEPVETPQDFAEIDTTFDETPVGDVVDVETIVEPYSLDVPPALEEQSVVVDQHEEQLQTLSEEPVSAEFVTEESDIPSADVVDDIPSDGEVEPSDVVEDVPSDREVETSIVEDDISHIEEEETTEEVTISEVPTQGETDLAVEHAEVTPTDEDVVVQDELSVGAIDDSLIETHESALASADLVSLEEPILAESTSDPVVADDVVEEGATATDRSVVAQDSGKFMDVPNSDRVQMKPRTKWRKILQQCRMHPHLTSLSIISISCQMLPRTLRRRWKNP